MTQAEWQTTNLVDGHTTAGRRIPIKTGGSSSTASSISRSRLTTPDR
jgi:hypothetical protein